MGPAEHCSLIRRRVPGAVNNAPVSISNGEVLAIRNPHSGDVTFAGRTGTLWLDEPSSFTGTVSDFGAKDGIDLPTMAFEFTNHGRLFTEEKRHRRHTDPYRTASSALKSRCLANTPRQVLAWQTITMAAPWLSLSHRNRPTNRCSVLLGMGENYRSCTAGDGGHWHDRRLHAAGNAAIDPSEIVFEAQSSLAYSQNSNRVGCTIIVPLAHNYAVELRYGERSPRRCPVL